MAGVKVGIKAGVLYCYPTECIVNQEGLGVSNPEREVSVS